MEQETSEQTHNLKGYNILLLITEICGAVLILLTMIWIFYFRGGLAWDSDAGKLFNWHPLLMVIGFVFLYANGMLIYRTKRTQKKVQLKVIHGGIMIFTFLLVIIAQISVFKMHNMLGIPNLYSLHSWVGVTTVILFFCQWLAGFISFYYPGVDGHLRAAYLPVHVYFGTAGFIGVIASCLLGLTEKAFFVLKEKTAYQDLPSEGVLINLIGLLIVIFGGLVMYLVSREQYRRLPQPEDNVLITRRND